MSRQDPSEPYNIIPVHDLLADHRTVLIPEVRAATVAIRVTADLPKPPSVAWLPHYDLLNWLALFFGFQNENARNQREHLVLHLANSQMRLNPPPDDIDTINADVITSFRRKLLENYTKWCEYIAVESSVRISSDNVDRRELLYVSLYLLIWGEAANLRFMPECLCYVFHHMALEMNKILDGCLDENTGQPFIPSYVGENAFLYKVVCPIYDTVRKEAERDGDHCARRNYDDINEYFWDKRCFQKLKWPLDLSCNFFLTGGGNTRVNKTGFVEQRSFWNLIRSFDRLWVMLILFMQVGVIVAWEERGNPWEVLKDRDVQVKVLSLFITWSGLRFLQSLLDVAMQYGLVSRERIFLGVRMVLKTLVAAGWIVVFRVLYRRICLQRNPDGRWSHEADTTLLEFLKVAFLFTIPELLSLAFLLFPWIQNFVEESNWKIFHFLTWWFQGRTFVGRGLRGKLKDTVMYTLFWILVLATKFTFSYTLQIKPMITPTKQLLHLKDVKYEWQEFFNNSNRLAVGLLWLPVVLMYLADIQIWYSIYSSIVGFGMGLLAHVGEIRNVHQLMLRFQFFASAINFNLLPKEQLLSTRGAFGNKLKDIIRQLKLRYGIGHPLKKLESSQVEAIKFSLVWNEIVNTFREEDIISDSELELLELPLNSWNITVIRWPCLLLRNELPLALSQAKKLINAPNKLLWHKICKNEYRRCAVIEAYESTKHLLQDIIKVNTEEYSIIEVLFQEIDYSIQVEKFNTTALPLIYDNLIKLIDLLNKPHKDQSKLVSLLQAIYEIAIRNFLRENRCIEQLIEDGLAPRNSACASGHLFENAVALPDKKNEMFYRQVRRLQIILTSRDSMNDIPLNLEARRRIAFFGNSLFMNMPHAPQVEKMMAFSVLTPYYREDVLYSEQLLTANENGISILHYLQTIHNDEWKNFLERMRREGMMNDDEIWTTKLRDLRFWASYRGNTLARTVRGMMYYYRALKMLAFLDSASEMAITAAAREITTMRPDGRLDDLSLGSSLPSLCLSRENSSVHLLYKGQENGTALMKFTFVVACQVYASQKAKRDPHAEEILYLMKNNEALRVSYVDEVYSGICEKEYYSVLAKYDQKLDQEVDIYRIKLPGPLKTGERKPESQNNALVFTRGDAVQVIDMNQDNYFEEALKMRNLLEEYNTYGTRKPTILGVREHIFTDSVSSLAWFISAQESSSVTLGQRFLANPLNVRMHYGHPDVFDRFWFLSRGGISKASRVINMSEDLFAGLNCTLRGGNFTHHEYIQVGKGRDVGLNQISMVEARVASGNSEQVLSRDVYRLGHRLDFFRMLSFFYNTVGYFFNTMMVILTVYAFQWGRLYFTLSGFEASMKSFISNNNKALGTILNQQFLIQLGFLAAVPLIMENTLEHGFLQAVWNFLMMQLQLSSVFYMFSMGTHSHFFGRTILHGGVKYRATGSNFGVQRKSFAENYRLYSRSHFIKAIELGLILTLYASHSPVATKTFVYIAMNISSWFLVASWILAPFVFNPSGFDWLKVVSDFDDFMNWIWYRSGVFATSEQSWEIWWYEEQNHLRGSSLWGKLLEITLILRFFFFQYSIVYQLKIAAGSPSIKVYLLSWICIAVAFTFSWIAAYVHEKYGAKKHIYYRMVQLIIIILLLLVLAALLKFTEFGFVDLFTSLLALLPTGWGLILIFQVLRPVLERTRLWKNVVSVARLYDILFGGIIMVPMAILSWMPGIQAMQTSLLFNEAMGRGIQILQIITGDYYRKRS